MLNRQTALVLASVLILSAGWAGCNLFEPVLTHGDDVETLLDDARYARLSGDYEVAVDLLETALELDALHPVVRFELASTLMTRDGLDLLMLERATSHVLDARSAPSDGRSFPSQLCTFLPDADVAPFDPFDFGEYEQIASSRKTLERVVGLMNGFPEAPGGGALPPAFTDLNVCTAITSSGLDYDRAHVLGSVTDRFEDDINLVTGALAVNAVAQTLLAYVRFFGQDDVPVDWYIVEGETIGACVAPGGYLSFVRRAADEVERVGRSMISLDLLGHHTGMSQLSELVDEAHQVFGFLQSDEVNPCS